MDGICQMPRHPLQHKYSVPLGAMTDLTAFPHGPLRFCPADGRVEGLCRQLEDIRNAGTPSPALAEKLYGKLMFLSSQYFGRLGRALLRAFSRRQHEQKRLV